MLALMRKALLIIFVYTSICSYGQNDSVVLVHLIKQTKFKCYFDTELLKYLDTIPSSSDSASSCYRTEIYSTSNPDVFYQKNYDSQERILQEGTVTQWYYRRRFWFGKKDYYDWNGKCKFYSYEENKVRYTDYWTTRNPGCTQTQYNVYKTEKIH